MFSTVPITQLHSWPSLPSPVLSISCTATPVQARQCRKAFVGGVYYVGGAYYVGGVYFEWDYISECFGLFHRFRHFRHFCHFRRFSLPILVHTYQYS